MRSEKWTQHTLADGSVWEAEIHTNSWRRKMAGVTKIGQHEVTEIKRDAAQVGCTRVTRAEVEQLLKQMDSAPREYDFNIKLRGEKPTEYLNFDIRHEHTGWVSASENKDTPHVGGGYGNRSAGFCLEKPQAQKLFEFLGGALGYDSYTQKRGSYTIIFEKV